MTDLTDGYHYAIVFDKERIIEKKKDLPIPYCEGFCCQNYQHLAPVPSYKELLALQSDSLAKNEGSEIVAELKAKVKQLKKDYKDLEYKFRSYKDFKETAYDFDTSRLEEENTKLKELLKECKEVIKNVDTYYGNYDSTNGFLIVEKINQALGEDK